MRAKIQSRLFYVLVLFLRSKPFHNKKNRLEIVLITSFYYTTQMHYSKQLMG